MASFPERIRRAFTQDGFEIYHKGAMIQSKEVAVYSSAGVMRNGPWIAYGLWFKSMPGAGDPPNRHELFHIYGGAEILCGISTTIDTAEYLKSKEELAQQLDMIEALVPKFSICLKKHLDIDFVIRRFGEDGFPGIVYKETRDFLSSELKRTRNDKP